MFRKLFIFTAMFWFVACAPIEKRSSFEQSIGVQHVAGVGDAVVTIQKSRNLENAFGFSDIYGRTTNEGSVIIRYMGMEDENTAVFARYETNIMTNETTMSRSPGLLVPRSTTTETTGYIGSKRFSARETTQGGYYHVPPPQAVYSARQQAPIFIRVKLATSILVVESRKIEILSASTSHVEYIIH